MNIRIVGDLHGLNWWKTINPDKYDKIIFLGDYVDSYDIKDNDIANNLLDLIEFKKSYESKVTLLYGNHDVQYAFEELYGYCSGFRSNMRFILHNIFEDNKDLFKFIETIELEDKLLIFSHAGISEGWAEYNYDIIDPTAADVFNEDSLEDIAIDISNYLLEVLSDEAKGKRATRAALNQVSYYRGGRYNFGGPLWADQTETERDWLKSNSDKPFIQFVGHTPNRKKTFETYHLDNSFISYCDMGGDPSCIEYNTDKEFPEDFLNKNEYITVQR